MLARIIKTTLIILVFMTAAGVGTYLSVHLLIRSEDTVVVPDLMGKEVVYALEMLTDLGLNTKVKDFEFSPSIPKHHIIAQVPEPGYEIKQGRDVRLVISKGARTVIFPNLTGMNLPQANILIEENDLRQGHLSYAYDKAKPREELLAQFPSAGTNGLRGNSVDLLISAGPAPELVRMVDLIGMGLNQAIETIEKHHLVLGTISFIHNPAVSDDTVVDHSPGADYPAIPGRTIDLVINRTTSNNLSAQRSDVTLFRYRASGGFLRQQARVRINRRTTTMELFDAFIKPGEEIWLLVDTDEPTTLFLYLDGELTMTKHYD